MRLRYISIPLLTAEAGGDPCAINKSLQVGRPGQISDLAEAFHAAGRCTSEANAAFDEARRRFEASWNHENGDHPINDSAEVQRVTKSLGVLSAQIPKIAVDLENIAAALAEAQRSASGQIATLEGQLQQLDDLIGTNYTFKDGKLVDMCTPDPGRVEATPEPLWTAISLAVGAPELKAGTVAAWQGLKNLFSREALEGLGPDNVLGRAFAGAQARAEMAEQNLPQRAPLPDIGGQPVPSAHPGLPPVVEHTPPAGPGHGILVEHPPGEPQLHRGARQPAAGFDRCRLSGVHPEQPARPHATGASSAIRTTLDRKRRDCPRTVKSTSVVYDVVV